MKKIYLFAIACITSLSLSMISCGDNTNVSALHDLTPDEIAEIARQDSIKEAQKNKINANLILEYSVDIIISESSYDGAKLQIETDKIAELFGITVEQLLAGIAGESGAPEIKGFAIDWTTRNDVGSASNTNAYWGHWWNAEGDVTTWGDTDVAFAEFNEEDGIFNIGQRPGRLVEGKTVKFIEGLSYNEQRVAVVITVNAKGQGEITAPIVNTQELSVNVTPKADYSQVPVQFDLAKTLADLGVSSMTEVKFLGVKNAAGSYQQEVATTNGFWYGADGFVGKWGDNARVYTTYGDEDEGFGENFVGIGQMPNTLDDGDKLTIQYAFYANDKIEMLKITINVIPYPDTETAPSGTPQTVEKTITLSKVWSKENLTFDDVDLKDILRDAFKMTTYQIHRAINKGELKAYLNEETEVDPKYTANAPGYWIDKDGKSADYNKGSNLVYCSLGSDETSLYLYGGQDTENSVAGSKVATKLILTCNGGKVILDLTFDLTSE